MGAIAPVLNLDAELVHEPAAPPEEIHDDSRGRAVGEVIRPGEHLVDHSPTEAATHAARRASSACGSSLSNSLGA